MKSAAAFAHTSVWCSRKEADALWQGHSIFRIIEPFTVAIGDVSRNTTSSISMSVTTPRLSIASPKGWKNSRRERGVVSSSCAGSIPSTRTAFTMSSTRNFAARSSSICGRSARTRQRREKPYWNAASSRRNSDRKLRIGESEFFARLVHFDTAAVLQLAEQNLVRERALDLRLDQAGHRPRAEDRIITPRREP